MIKIYKINNHLSEYQNSFVDCYLDPYNPLNLPPNTVRVRTSDGNPPIKDTYTSYDTATLVPGATNVYNVYKSGSNFANLFRKSSNVTEVLGANTTNIIDMSYMFSDCSSLTNIPLFDTSKVTVMTEMFVQCIKLTTVPLFDTSNVTHMYGMFQGCTSLTSVPLFNTHRVTVIGHMFSDCSSLTSIPLFDTTNVTDMEGMFYACMNVESGALALYQQASTQTNTPGHYLTFRYCGSNTQTGSAELAQIPSDWK